MSELNATLDLPLGVIAPAAARTAVRHMLIAWELSEPDWLDDAELVVSELVTNAVRHGGGCIELSLQAHEGQVLVRPPTARRWCHATVDRTRTAAADTACA